MPVMDYDPLAQKTVCFIGEITVKADSRGIYSLENINYRDRDAYLNIPAIDARSIVKRRIQASSRYR